jgi:hypothetical protein
MSAIFIRAGGRCQCVRAFFAQDAILPIQYQVGRELMDANSTVKLIAAVLAVLLVVIIVMRRKKKKDVEDDF